MVRRRRAAQAFLEYVLGTTCLAILCVGAATKFGHTIDTASTRMAREVEERITNPIREGGQRLSRVAPRRVVRGGARLSTELPRPAAPQEEPASALPSR